MASINGINGDRQVLPPSTLAAQLAESHAHPDRTEPPENDEALHQLLAEIRNNPDSLDADVQSNYTLITVIANAALKLTPSDPSCHARITAGLGAISIAFDRNPRVLLFAPPSGSATIAGDPLCLVLFPRLFALLSGAGEIDIVDDAGRILSHIVATLSKQLLHNSELRAVQELLLGSAEAMLALAEEATSFPARLPANLVLPPDEARARAFPLLQASIAVNDSNRIKVPHVSAGIVFACSLGAASVASKHSKTSHDSAMCLRACSIASKALAIEANGNAADDSRTSTSLEYILLISTSLLRISCSPDCTKASRRQMELVGLKANAYLLNLRQLPAASETLAGTIESFLAVTAATVNQSARFLNALLGALRPYVSERVGLVLLQSFPNLELQLSQLLADLARAPAVPTNDRKNTAEPIAKRPRIEGHAGDQSPLQQNMTVVDTAGSLVTQLCILLGSWNPSDISKLPKDVEQLFADLSHSQKLQVLTLLGSICCGTNVPRPVSIDLAAGGLHCVFCGAAPMAQSPWHPQQWNTFFLIMVALSQSSSIQTSKDYRVVFALALRRFAYHVPDRSYVELEDARSQLGTWCLQSLRSSFRELRTITGHILPLFCMSISKFPEQICLSNRRLALRYLRELSDSKDAKLAETAITTLCNLTQTGGDEEMNLILLQLVDFLGHTNPLICSSAQLNLRRIAETKGCEIGQLISPFWDSIAIQIVKDLPAKPQKVQQLADLLGAPVNLLLLNTQPFTVPYLILWKNTDALRRLAQARSEDASVWSMCMNKKNINPTIARILVEYPTNAEAAIADCLSCVHSDLGSQDPVDLIKSDPIALACEVLKIAADKDGEQSQRAFKGFKELAAIIERRGHTTKTATTQAKMTANFFENHSLGIMQHFSDCIDSSNESCLAKKRCLRAIHRMIEVGRNELSVALPQIRSCLQSALESFELRNEAFATWLALVDSLDKDEDLENLVENTFVIITQNWNDLDPANQDQAHETVAGLIGDHQGLILNLLEKLPSFGPIPMLSKFENEINRLKGKIEPVQKLKTFATRIQNENVSVVLQALQELSEYLDAQQQWIHDSSTSEQPDQVIADLLRALLDVVSGIGRSSEKISYLATKSLGFIGAVDPNRIEATRDKHDLIVLSNFDQAEDAVEFVSYVLEHILVKAFYSVTNPRAQGFLAYTMQEMLRFCGFSKEALQAYRPHGTQMDDLHMRWTSFPESVRNTMTPFLSSKYVLTTRQNPDPADISFPTFSLDKSYGTWIRELSFNMMLRATGVNATKIFTALRRIVRGYDASIAAFLLPYAVANVVIGGSEQDSKDVIVEILAILDTDPRVESKSADMEVLKQCSECIFQVLDYLSKWLHDKRGSVSAAMIMASRSGRPIPEAEARADQDKIDRVARVLKLIPARKISERALECKSFARALRHWEDHIRQELGQVAPTNDQEPDKAIYDHLHSIYAQIDDPDGLEGIAVNMPQAQEQPAQVVLNHQKAGRWSAAESWFEHFLKLKPADELHVHEDLVTCLSKSGKYFAVIDHVKSLADSGVTASAHILADASEAAWRTFQWTDLEAFNAVATNLPIGSFNQGLSRILLSFQKRDLDKASAAVNELRLFIARAMTPGTTTSLQASRDQLLSLQALNEVEMIMGINQSLRRDAPAVNFLLNKRLDVVGSYPADQQFLLGVRRAAMMLAPRDIFDTKFIGQSWLASAKLARKGGDFDVAHAAAIEANELGASSACIELARYLWNQGEHRKAIHSLRSIIDSDKLQNADSEATVQDFGTATAAVSMTASHVTAQDKQKIQNLSLARANLLLAKWLDRAGQTQSIELNAQYQKAANAFSRWERSYYNLGRFYNKLLEAEKAMPVSKQSARMLSGETTKLVIENYLRSLMFGCKHISESLPKLLTLWLDFGNELGRNISKEVPDDVREKATTSRPRMFDAINKQVKKYGDKVPTFLLYTALNQMMSRIGHANAEVYSVLSGIITRVVAAHPQQALWPLLAVGKSSKIDRANRGIAILQELRKRSKNIRHESDNLELKHLIQQGQRLADALLDCCNKPVDARVSTVRLSKDLRFNMNVAPCALVVPWEQMLSAALPASTGNNVFKNHRAFPMSREAITIQSFHEEVLVLSSLQRPRKIVVKGSDGNRYGLLCKPKDDLRKDQRLMEFNSMINRSLKRDAESLKRRLYIRTNAVTPLNEECGVLEWVEGLKPLRDILLSTYRAKGIKVDYNLLRDLLNQACDPSNKGGHLLFTNQILPMYKPALHEWFTELFPAPDTWLAARMRYTHSCAVMSMSGHVLGLGDRHGENVSLEQGSGGIFHVDFNCLFDKGLTFEKPELVPFRLTHNMVDAFGAYGVDGPFRRSAECTMHVMRANESALLTTLETFVYDPTADFVGSRRRHVKGVPETPKEVLDSVQSKVRGLMRGDNVPLSVAGHVDALIAQATDPRNLCAMYIGWCAFL